MSPVTDAAAREPRLKVLVYSDDANVRQQVILALGRRPHPDLPELEYVVSHPAVLIGFSDAGAHLRNMAYYDFPLHLLRLVRRASAEGRTVMSDERAVHRLTGEIALPPGLSGTFEHGGRSIALHPGRQHVDGKGSAPSS